MTTTTDQPPTQAQFDYLKDLIAKHDVSGVADIVDAARERAVAGTMTRAQASALIDLVKVQPLRGTKTEAAELTPGVYRATDGVLYRVYPARADRSRMLAKEIVVDGALNHLEFVYAGAASRFVQPEGRLTLEEAKAFGATTGYCIACGAELTDPDSIAAGIGPVCATKF